MSMDREARIDAAVRATAQKLGQSPEFLRYAICKAHITAGQHIGWVIMNMIQMHFSELQAAE